jgi:Domain of unknown function (DUF1995)
MIAETMRALNFKSSEISKREYLGGEIGEDDAVGIWSDLDQQVCICCFPTPDTIPAIIEYKKWTNINSIFVIINQQFFLDPLSKDESKTFLSSAEIIYRLESLNMRGPGALPVRGLLYRQYPHQFKVSDAPSSHSLYCLSDCTVTPTLTHSQFTSGCQTPRQGRVRIAQFVCDQASAR